MRDQIRDAIMLAVTPIIQDHKRDQECAEAVIGGLLSAGYVIVPREPSEEMVRLGDRAYNDFVSRDAEVIRVFRAMVGADGSSAQANTVPHGGNTHD